MRIGSASSCLTACAALALSSGAAAQPAGAAPPVARLDIKPILETRTRHEYVEQGALDADATTIRIRAGAEASYGPVSLLAEGEATLAPVDRYNAFPFALSTARQWRPADAVVADPENVELNRLQLQYRYAGGAVTAGRQRINLDDQRWVGSVDWRQNEQTFDAVRATGKLGPAALDVTYAIAQRTIFGTEASARSAFDGQFLFAGAAAGTGPVQGKLFAYLLDYDEAFLVANSSQTYGGLLTAGVPLTPRITINLRASYARQSDYGGNPFDYMADYWAIEAGTRIASFELAAGAETLGTDNGRSVQTPMATGHKFNGWADLFLATPPDGLEDRYLSVTRRFDGAKTPSGLNLSVTLHRFDSALGGLRYGHELDASVGIRLKPVSVLVKYARYEADGFGVDTSKVWVQLEAAL